MALINTPVAGQTLTSSRSQINANFANISTDFAVDHVGYNTGGAGFHNQITFTQQSGARTFVSPQIGMYNIVSTVSGANELYIRKGAGNPIPLTQAASDGAGPYASTGYYYLPSGLLVKYGSVAFSSIGPAGTMTGDLTFPVSGNIPVFNSVVYSAQLSISNNTTGATQAQITCSINVIGSNLFKISVNFNNTALSSTGNFRCIYTAIGI